MSFASILSEEDAISSPRPSIDMKKSAVYAAYEEIPMAKGDKFVRAMLAKKRLKAAA